jgi:hypothetical protein
VVKWRGRKWTHTEKFKKCSLLKILNSLFSKERLLELFFLSFFSMLLFLSLFLCSVSLLSMNSGIFEMFEEKTFFSNFVSNGMKVATPRFMNIEELRIISR